MGTHESLLLKYCLSRPKLGNISIHEYAFNFNHKLVHFSAQESDIFYRYVVVHIHFYHSTFFPHIFRGGISIVIFSTLTKCNGICH